MQKGTHASRYSHIFTYVYAIEYAVHIFTSSLSLSLPNVLCSVHFCAFEQVCKYIISTLVTNTVNLYMYVYIYIITSLIHCTYR